MRAFSIALSLILLLFSFACDKTPARKVTVPIAHKAKVMNLKTGWTGQILKSGQEVELKESNTFIGTVNNEPYTATLVFKNDEKSGLRLGNRAILGAIVKVFITAPKDDAGLELLYEKCSKTIVDPKNPFVQKLDLGHTFDVWLRENADARLRGVANSFKNSDAVNMEREHFNERIKEAICAGGKAMKIPFIIEDVQLVDFSPTVPKPLPPPVGQKKIAKVSPGRKYRAPKEPVIIPIPKM